MINELYELSEAMGKAGVQTQSWHKKYKEIPRIRDNAPCVRIMIFKGNIIKLSSVEKELGTELRKFGVTNQGSYPCMNLAPLYRITDDAIKKELSNLILHPEDLKADKINEIKNWCQKDNDNWRSNFQNNYKKSMQDRPDEMLKLISEFNPLQILIKETNYFRSPEVLRQKLENKFFEMLSSRENVSLAFSILFYRGNATKKAVDDYGKLSVAFETPQLIDMGVPAVSRKFVLELNEALLSADSSEKIDIESSEEDAFGILFEPDKDNGPMPDVKLAGGFTASLRTMFHAQRCQTRYGRIENASYPISPKMQKKLQAALSWLGNDEHRDMTWVGISKNEILFAYPTQLPEIPVSYTRMFKPPEKRDVTFGQQAKQFIDELRQSKKTGTDSAADKIQLFILKKIEKGRTKVVYTRQTDPHELEACSEAWTIGCSNLPPFPFGQPNVLFPLDTADILNRFWKQNGELATDKFKPVPKYYGMELLMESDLSVTSALHNLSEKGMTIGAFLGNRLAGKEWNHPIWYKIKDMLALMGLLLYRKGIGKDGYMKNLPYLYGQLLKVSDELHALYCNVERNGELPTRLAGSVLYQAAAEAPVRTLQLLGQRMNPYITWAKTYRTKGKSEKKRESAEQLLSMYEDIATKLYATWHPESRFNDEEKAQLFIGYLAAFPKKEHSEKLSNQDEEVHDYEREN